MAFNQHQTNFFSNNNTAAVSLVGRDGPRLNTKETMRFGMYSIRAQVDTHRGSISAFYVSRVAAGLEACICFGVTSLGSLACAVLRGGCVGHVSLARWAGARRWPRCARWAELEPAAGQDTH